jgi:fibronectin type 3 domain-containing protein
MVAAAGVSVALAAITPNSVAQAEPDPQNAPTQAVNPDPFDASRFPLELWHPDIDEPVPAPDHPPIDQVPPMPMSVPRGGPPMGPPPLDFVTVYDAETGESTVLPLGDPNDPVARISEPPYVGADGHVDRSLEMQRNLGTMVAVSSASLSAWPARGNCRLLMRFVDTSGANRYFVCSGSMIDGGVVLTAAHCVYGREADGPDIFDWAREIWVYPGWNGSGNSLPDGDDVINSWGWARGTYYLAGSGYINSGDWDRDCGLIRLNRGNTRSVGMITGWYGWGLNICSTGVTHYNYSYPAETCSATRHTGRQMYFWDGPPDGCPGLFNGNQYDLDTSGGCFGAVWGGMSGSSMNRYYDGGGPYSVAVCSTSNRSSDANYCALWDQFVTDMNNSFTAGTRGTTFDIEALMYRTGSGTVVQGSSIGAGSVRICNATDYNPGARTYTLRLYLSSNNDISTSDTLLATYNYSNVNFGTMNCITFNIPATPIPYNTPTGTRYVGVIIDAAEDTNDSNSDTDTWDADVITVGCFQLSPPTGVTATDGVYCDRVFVDWNASTGASQYYLYRNTTNSTSGATLLTSTTATSYNDSSASASGTGYYYWVRSDSNCDTSSYSAAAYGYRGSSPSTPTGVSATDGTGCERVTVSWNAVSGATAYWIYRNTVNSTIGISYLGSDTASPFVDATGVPGTVYYYFVRADNACGTSGYSASNSGYGGTGIFFDAHPMSITVPEGQPAQFTVVADGAGSYQWRKDGVNLSNGANITGATTDTLTILAAAQTDEGNYACFVTSRCGNATSNSARLTVDEFGCPADYNNDGGIDGADIEAFFADWEGGDPAADVNQDGGVDGSDVSYFFEVWEAGGC